MTHVRELNPKQLYRQSDPEQFGFQTTEDLEELEDIVGQPRAVEAIKFGVGIQAKGYNIFALGPTGTGKWALVHRYFEQRARNEPVPDDWCYVYNFEERHKPNAIRLPAGKGEAFRKDVQELIQGLSTALTAAFESEEYQSRRQTIIQELQERQSDAFQVVQDRAHGEGVTLLRTPTGLVFAPLRDGEVLSPEQVRELSEEERKHLESEVEGLQGELQKIVQQVPGWQRETQNKLRELDREMANFAIIGPIDELKDQYGAYEEIVEHLDAVQKDIVENARRLVGSEEQEGTVQALVQRAAGQESGGESPLLRRYRVNLLVGHAGMEGAPVVYEDNPTYQSLVGRVEHVAQMGALVTDFNLIKPGALHRANGGYLILDARASAARAVCLGGAETRAAVRRDPHRIGAARMLSLTSTISLEPEPIPLEVKVVLVGEPHALLPAAGSSIPILASCSRSRPTSQEQMDRDWRDQQPLCPHDRHPWRGARGSCPWTRRAWPG